jgi:phosphatidylinositol alpha 1,6-mannosyltransferase
MSSPTRVAYFPDSFHEVNGVAHTSRQFEAFARRRDLPFLCVRAGEREQSYLEENQVETLELPRGILSFALDKDLRFDPAFLRHRPDIVRTLAKFRPNIIHITGPSEIGMLGAALAHKMKVPLVASWHTNVHEYAARRSDWFLRVLPKEGATRTAKKIEDVALFAAARFYSLAKILFAPNLELCEILEKATNRPCYLMQRGVDTELFSPAHRTRPSIDEDIVLGYVGRLSVEKNILLLSALRTQLLLEGITRFRFLIVGQGAEEGWLRENLPNTDFASVLRGSDLSRAYANMDLFVFPSHTDTFGNVVLEALASGVPAIVTPDGGPRYIVRDGETGIVATDENFPSAVAGILRDPVGFAAMRMKAREQALSASWDAVFEGVYSAYDTVLKPEQ